MDITKCNWINTELLAACFGQRCKQTEQMGRQHLGWNGDSTGQNSIKWETSQGPKCCGVTTEIVPQRGREQQRNMKII